VKTGVVIFNSHTGRVDHDVFISYSRRDKDFVEALDEKLRILNKDTWVDWSRIPATAKWWEEIEDAIEAANTFVFVISPDSVHSKYCHQEIDHAVKFNKRLVPILRRDLVSEEDVKAIHPAMSAHQWVCFREKDDFDNALQTLVTAINTDLEYVRAHTELLLRAIKWDSKGHNNSFLLRGSELKEARQWLSQSAAKKPQSTQLQKEYISSSRLADRKSQLMTFITVVSVFQVWLL
jgi:hypothetical protein